MNIVFDLDGTLIDASERMYCLFQMLVPQSTLTKKEYWERKRNKIGHQQILEAEFPNVSFADFNDQWLRLIESSSFLNMDFCYADTLKVLQKLYGKYELYILTARQHKDLLLEELKRVKIFHFFDKIFVTENKKNKEQLLEQMIFQGEVSFTQQDMFVSDMGKDIKLGNKCNFRTVAITHGFMSKEKLLEYEPNFCIDTLSELMDIVHE